LLKHKGELKLVTESELLNAKRASKISIFLILFGVTFMLGSLFYATKKIGGLKDQISDLTQKSNELSEQINQKSSTKVALEKDINNLTGTQRSIFDFLASITRANKIKFIDPEINWPKVQKELIDIKPGKRKEAIFGAIIMASVGTSFKLGKGSFAAGFDSSTFIEYVLSQVGVQIKRHPTKYLSETIMGQCTKVQEPKPGDLLFYKGEIGNFGLFYLGPGNSTGKGIAVGALESANPCVIMDTSSINPLFDFIGYFRVNYPDER
jgi:cell wall-associated NlpC family hydrolase